MYDSNIFADDTEASDESMELGLIGAMFDGYVEAFDFRNLRVRRKGNSISIANDPLKPEVQSGNYYIPTGNVNDAHEWLERKADLYGGA